jgi:nucleoside-diphosphate-sugar epimerase
MTENSMPFNHFPPRRGEKPLVLMTGPEGLIGGRIIERLTGLYSLVGFDRPPSPHDGEHIDYVQVDLTKPEQLDVAFKYLREYHGDRIASVIHLAAYYDFKGEPSRLYNDLTVEGTRRLLRHLQDFEVEQFIFSSSLLVMEPTEPGVLVDESSPTLATWDYPESKLRAEEVIRQERGDIPAVILRIAGVYDEDGYSIPVGQQISRIYEKQLESYLFPGDPDHGQAFVHLDDLADCFAQVIDRRQTLSDYEVFLVSEPDVMSYDELQDSIGQELHGREWPTIRIPKFVAKAGAWVKDKMATEEDPAFIKPWMIDLADQHLAVNIDKARTKLGWNPEHSLRQTLPELLRRLKQDPRAWYERNGFAPPKSLNSGTER